MLRNEKIQSFLLIALFDDDIKIFLFMNCWFSFNRQEYLTINAYFIDDKWIYHEVLLAFEHVTESHTNTRLTKIMQDIIIRHKLQDRILAITSDNVENNNTMHVELLRMLRIKMFDDINFNVRNIKRVFCLAHVIQLALRELLEKIRINSTNETFQISWNDKQDRAIMKKEEKEVSYTLAKVSIDRCLFKEDYSQVIYNSRYELFSYTLIVVWIHPNSWHQTWSQWTRQCLNRWWIMIEMLAS
jgi:hypothetical protein